MNIRIVLLLVYTGGSYVALSSVYADDALSTNEATTSTWQQGNASAPVPVLVQQVDGTTKLEWHGGATVNYYNNSVETAAGQFGTPLNNGSFYNLQGQSDLRSIADNGNVDYFQIGVTRSNDPAVLSLYHQQINNVQVGRSGPGYLLAAGDVAPNFSSLSSALGLRGLIAQKQLDQTSVTGYAGVVVPSWEYLGRQVPRYQLIRDVRGVKVEHAFSPTFKLYGTGQYGAEREGTADIPGLMPTIVRSGSVGFQYNAATYQVTGETAVSHFEQQLFGLQEADKRVGLASIIDGSWRGQSLSLRAGYHDLGPGYVSLSQMASPGIREVYTGADWVAAPWISVGADLRNSKNISLATLFSPSQLTDTNSANVRANINFGSAYPGWALSVQQNISLSRNPVDQLARNQQTSLGLNYANQNWAASLSFGLGIMRNEAATVYDSDTSTWQGSISRNFNNMTDLLPASWTVSANLSASLQSQDLLVGDTAKAYNATLGLSGQRTGWGVFNVSLGNGYNTRPNGLSTLWMTFLQADFSRPLTEKVSAKIYLRNTRRNIADPTLAAEEQNIGMQLGYNF
ncbi:MAG: hypothetical protein HOP20_06585 [Sulfuriferula sp.]|nr:hypothetical protein [Sulfuriferula sp.]